MLSFLKELWYGVATKSTQNGEIGELTTNSQASRSRIPFLDMIWYGFLGRFSRHRIPKEIEAKEKEKDSENIGKQSLNESSTIEESLTKTTTQNAAITVTDDFSSLTSDSNLDIKNKDEPMTHIGTSTKNSSERLHTTKVLKMAAFFEEMALNSSKITNSRYGDQQLSLSNKKLPLITAIIPSSESDDEINKHPLENSYTDSRIHDGRSLAEEVIIGFISQSILLIPIATIHYVNNFKQMDISIENHHEKLHFTTEGCFIKGGKLKNLLPTEISCGENAQIIFDKQITNIKMAIRGVLTYDILPSEKGVTCNGQATLVIWWKLPALSKNVITVGIVNNRVNATKSLYKRMKHEQEEWFKRGAVYEIVKKEYSQVLGKYDLNIAAQINDRNRASCRVEIG